MTVQHLGPLHDPERAEDRQYRESSPLLHNDGNFQETSSLRNHTRKFLIFILFLAVTLVTRSLIQSPRPTKYSLWLVPPPRVRDSMEAEISFLAKRFGGPSFDPHVTIVGGVSFDSIHDARKFVSLLRDELDGFGAVDAKFEPKVENYNVWSQALVVKMDASAKFIYLCQTVRKVLNMDNSTSSLFPAPVNAPHISLFYGADNAPNADDLFNSDMGNPAIDFTSDTIALWKTDPSNAEGVPQWELFEEISLA